MSEKQSPKKRKGPLVLKNVWTPKTTAGESLPPGMKEFILMRSWVFNSLKITWGSKENNLFFTFPILEMFVLIGWLASFVKDAITDINYPLKALLEKKKTTNVNKAKQKKTIQIQLCSYLKYKMCSVKLKHQLMLYLTDFPLSLLPAQFVLDSRNGNGYIRSSCAVPRAPWGPHSQPAFQARKAALIPVTKLSLLCCITILVHNTLPIKHQRCPKSSKDRGDCHC